MANTLGYHLVKSGYGLWLPGDNRGHWSEAWDPQIGFVEPHTLHAGDPVRLRMAQERMKHPPCRLSSKMIDVVGRVIGRCATESPWRIEAASIEPTHTHLLITYSGLDSYNTAKWLADQTTKAIHRQADYSGPVWCKGNWCSFIFDKPRWTTAKAYVERHNTRRGLSPRPFSFIA